MTKNKHPDRRFNGKVYQYDGTFWTRDTVAAAKVNRSRRGLLTRVVPPGKTTGYRLYTRRPR